MIPVEQPQEIELILIELEDINRIEKEAQANLAKARMTISTLAPKRLHLVKRAISTNPTKEKLAEVLKKANYDERTMKRYQAMRQWNKDTGDTLTVVKEYEAKAKAVKKITREEVLKADPTISVAKAKKVAKEHNLKAKKEAVQSDKKENVTLDKKPTYEDLEAKIQSLKAKLKKETALKKQYHEKLKGVDLTPLKEAEEALNIYRANLTKLFGTFADMERRKHENKVKFMLKELRGDNPFKVLGLPDTATLEEAKSKYRELAKKYHPDLTETDNIELFRKMTEAYKTIKEMK